MWPQLTLAHSQNHRLLLTLIPSGRYSEEATRRQTLAQECLQHLVRPNCQSPHHLSLTSNSIGLFFVVGLFDLWWGLATIILDAIVTYLIAGYVQGPYMPWIGFVWLMGHMSVSHIYRHMLNDPAVIDITGAQMVLVMKLSAFCWNVWDGRQKQSELNDTQKDRMLVKLPNPLDFAGFVFFFPALHAGPAFDYIDYHRWLNTTMFDLPPGTDPMKAPPTRKKRRIPRSGTPAMLKLGAGLIWLVLFLQLSPFYNPSVILGDQFTKHNILWRIFHLHMLNFVTRMKYYGVWMMAEGACILSGIGYKGLDPKTGKPDWSRLTNIRPSGVEFAQNSHAYLGNWNMNTNHWLRNYIYLRVTPKGKKPGFRASMATFVTSAFWHGFEPGYYMAFVLASFIQNVAKSKHLPVSTHSESSKLTRHTRLPPPPPPLLHDARRQTPNPLQTLLRRLHLARNPTSLHLHHHTLHPALAPRQSTRLVARLLLRHYRRRHQQPLPPHTRKDIPPEESQGPHDGACSAFAG